MGDKNANGFDIGFSDEEKEDLDKMIGAFNEDRQALVLEPTDEKLIHQMEAIMDRFFQLGEIVTKTNKRLDSFYEIIQLMYHKSEIMNDRINTLIRTFEKDTDFITE
jgi:Trm5-related predicted tRNA methylase